MSASYPSCLDMTEPPHPYPYVAMQPNPLPLPLPSSLPCPMVAPARVHRPLLAVYQARSSCPPELLQMANWYASMREWMPPGAFQLGMSNRGPMGSEPMSSR